MLPLLPLVAQAGAATDSLIKVVDKAEAASDRWLFLATVIVLVLFCAAVIRYLIKDREASRQEHAAQLAAAYAEAAKARQEHAATMEKMYGEQTKLAAQLLVALQENNTLLADSRKVMESMERVLQQIGGKA